MPKPRTTLTVLRSQWLTEHLVRVYFGGPGFGAFQPNGFTDSYVKFAFPGNGGEVRRAYTIRAVDVAAQEIVVDFVYHGDEGVAGPWAATVQAGDTIDVIGPGGAYAPRGDADWHLLAGDEAALPAISAALAALPADAVGEALVEVGGVGDELSQAKPAGVRLTWLHRGDRMPGRLLGEAVRGLAWRPGRVQVFVHGEAQVVMHDLRGYLRKDRGVPAEWASISGYWRYGDTDERFRQWKTELAAREAAGSTS